MLYFSLIYTKILYGIEQYANTYLTYLHDLIILNNRLLRILQNKDRFSHASELYRSYNTLPIDKLFIFQILIHAHSLFYKSSRLPLIFHKDLILNNQVHSYSTRSSTDFHRNSSLTSVGRKSTLNLCAIHWNVLPTSIKSIPSINQFKKLVKQHLSI